MGWFNITKGNVAPEKLLDVQKMLGARVLSKNELMVGRIVKIYLSPKNNSIEAVLVRRGIFGDDILIDKEYFNRFSNDSLILSIDPYFFLISKKVVTAEGKTIGRVKEVHRNNSTNDFSELLVTSSLKKFVIPATAISLLGNSIILKGNYNVRAKYFWQRD